MTAKRNSLAFAFKGKNEMKPLIEEEKLDASKIYAHARAHEARLKTITTLSQTKEKLRHQLDNRLPYMDKSEAEAWHKAWEGLNDGLSRISNNPSMYPAKSRAEQSPLTFAKNEQAMLSDNEIACVSHAPGIGVKNKPTPLYPYKKNFLDASKISETLLANPEETYRSIFGEPKKITSKEMRFEGGLIVSLKGGKTGLWYDFSAGVGGNPIQAIMHEQGLSFSEALKEAASIAGISGLEPMKQPFKEKRVHAVTNAAEEKNKIISARSILKGGVPIKGTLAERYLKEHRNIEKPELLNVSFWPKGAVWKATDDNGDLYEKTNKIPALLIAAKNEKGEVTGVQRVYLDEKTGGKNTFMSAAKLSKGEIESSAGIIQKGEKLGTLYLAEGPETAATLAMANPKATVLVSFGLSNLKNLSRIIKNHYPTEVIIAGDNDTLSKNNTFDVTKHAQALLKQEGVASKIIIPKAINGGAKTDWNDVHKSEGINQVKEQLGLIKKDIYVNDVSAKFARETHHEEKELMRAFNQIARENQQVTPGTIDKVKSSSIEQKTLDLEI